MRANIVAIWTLALMCVVFAIFTVVSENYMRFMVLSIIFAVSTIFLGVANAEMKILLPLHRRLFLGFCVIFFVVLFVGAILGVTPDCRKVEHTQAEFLQTCIKNSTSSSFGESPSSDCLHTFRQSCPTMLRTVLE